MPGFRGNRSTLAGFARLAVAYLSGLILADAAVTSAPAPDTAPLVSNLRGLMLIAKPEHAKPQQEASGLDATEVPLLQEAGFLPVAAKYLGKPVSLASLNALSQDIVLYFRNHDRPVVDVSIPEQDITNGTVQLVVVEGRLGDVRVEGGKWLPQERLRRRWGLSAGSELRSSRILREIDWLNQNPFRHVEAVYTPGRDFGLTDVILRVQDRFPFRAFVGYENSGTKLTGEHRALTGFQWGNLLGSDSLLSYQFMADSDFDRFFGHTASLTIPLPWRHRLKFFGGYVDSSAEVEAAGAPISLSGESVLVGMRYEIPLPDAGSLRHEASLGFDFKRSTNDLEFNRVRVTDAATDIFAFSAAYQASLPDKLGGTTLSISGVYGPGGWSSDSSDEAYEQVREDADAGFFLARAELERITRLPGDFSLYLKASGQLASTNLLPGEQMMFGGWESVRGYEERILLGDDGLLLTAEVRSPALHPLRLCGAQLPGESLQFLAFWDYGSARSHQRLPDEPAAFSLMSVGAGLRYAIGSHLSLRFDYGWALDREDEQPSGRGHFGVTVGF